VNALKLLPFHEPINTLPRQFSQISK